MSKELEVFNEIIELLKHYIKKDGVLKEEVADKQDMINGYPIENIRNALKEHEQYKSIEEELGIDLITLFNILREKECFVKNSGVCYIMGFSLSGLILMPKAFPYGECEYHVPLKDYGKTWALTKEVLL